MGQLSKKSMENLLSCDKRLQAVFWEVLKYYDFTVLCGRRNKEDQEKAFNEGKSKAHFGESPHNEDPARAVDVVPYPLDWNDRERMCFFAGFVRAIGLSMGINIRWGGDWDGDLDLKDNKISDLPHFELVDK